MPEIPVRLRARDVHVEEGGDDAAPLFVCRMHVIALEPKRGPGVLQDGDRHAEVDERGDGHVAREPARRVEEEDASAPAAGAEHATRAVGGAVVVIVVVIVVRAVIVTVTVIMIVIMTVIVRMLVILVAHHLLRARRMRAAANAAPNPLSMFTTVMPDAQLVSIPRRAASPWNAAP